MVDYKLITYEYSGDRIILCRQLMDLSARFNFLISNHTPVLQDVNKNFFVHLFISHN